MSSNLADEGQPHRERNRLRKPTPLGELQNRDDFLDIVHLQSLLNSNRDENSATLGQQRNSDSLSRQGDSASIRSKKANDSISWYSHYEMRVEELRRTRAKTPVLRIGQLEGRSGLDVRKDVGLTRPLGPVYQGAPPSRAFTPSPRPGAQNTHRNSLRRMKCHDSLRDVAKTIPEHDEVLEFAGSRPTVNGVQSLGNPSNPNALQDSITDDGLMRLHSSRSRFRRGSFESQYNRRGSMDSETLVGSDTDTSPNSPASRSFSLSDRETIKTIRDRQNSSTKQGLSNSNTVGMQLCMDLLANDLSAALSRQHPAKSKNKIPGLQVLLMIEAYESLQRRLRQEMFNSRVMDFSEEQLKTVDNTLDHWLQALRSIYECSLT